MSYFKKHWPADLQEDVVKCVEGVVSETFKLCRSWVACYLYI
jgi:hypothetical protein